MIAFPNCKINLGLSVLGKRDDGFHNIETVFYPISLHDALEMVIDTGTGGFSTSGLTIEGIPENNLCLKAVRLIENDFPDISPVKIHLHKAIPLGAGLGGGSADGTFTLLLLKELFKLDISPEKLAAYALQLGSDCPFFLLNKPCFARGRGEQLQEIALDLSAYSLKLINPGIHINTAWAFSSLPPSPAKNSLRDAIQEPVSAWRTALVNDFEQPVFELYPEIREIRDTMYRQGALYSAMTGTGSTVFGIFDKGKSPVFPENYRVYTAA